MKKVSLKALIKERDLLNELIPDYLTTNGHMFYITAFGKDIETKQDIFSIDRKDIFAQRSNSNWSYFLVLGKPRNEKGE